MTDNQQPTIDPTDLNLLPTAEMAFRWQGVMVQGRRGNEEWHEVRLLRLFPLTEPEAWLSVQDTEGKEIGILESLHGLAPESLAVVREALGRRYLIPQITRILGSARRFDLVEWTVETDRGAATIVLRHPQENVKHPLPRRLTITDVEGNRYDIPDVDLLDPASRRRLEDHI